MVFGVLVGGSVNGRNVLQGVMVVDGYVRLTEEGHLVVVQMLLLAVYGQRSTRQLT